MRVHTIIRLTATQAIADSEARFKKELYAPLSGCMYATAIPNEGSYKLETEELKERLLRQNLVNKVKSFNKYEKLPTDQLRTIAGFIKEFKD